MLLMAEIIKRRKPLSVSPLKASQPVGATLAFLGLNKAMPMMHGSQGCTAFAKVFFVRHFREPVPLQTTAMDQVSTVMGADDNIVEGLKTVAEKSQPAVIGLFTTGLSETQGADIFRGVREFRAKYPQFDNTAVVPVNTPDFTGCAETGFAAAVKGIIDVLVPDASEAGTVPGRRQRQVNVLVSSALTPGDLEALQELCEAFELRPVLIPDLSDSLDGHLEDGSYNPLTTGGTPLSEFATLGDAAATLVIGRSLKAAADLLAKKTGVPDYRFDGLMGLDAMDDFVNCLQQIAGRPVPSRIERHRAQLQDAMLDTHFMLGQARVAMALEPDLLAAMSALVTGMGAELVAAVSPGNAPVLADLPCEKVQVGDLDDLEKLAADKHTDILIGNSHAAETARRLSLPLLRAGFPQYDLVGGYQRTWIGYRGTRQALFDLANIMLTLEKGEIHPYQSPLAQKPAEEVARHGHHSPSDHPLH
jgi:nitrogenase molybdenum-iron protein NifN